MKIRSSKIKKVIHTIMLITTVGAIIAGYRDREQNKKLKHKQYGIYEAYVKRPLDFTCGILVLAFFWPIYIIVAILVKGKLGTPIIFKQERPGRNGKIFSLYKFRTMTDERDENGELLPDEVRLTKFGKLLRSTSLDELPEVFNIIRGDMSVIGPRPLLVKDVECMSSQQLVRHNVRPGLTGLAQCNGRNSLNWDQKLSMDVEYVGKYHG